MTYLIDTDWVIHQLNGVIAVTNKLDELSANGLALSIISLAELYEGVYYSQDPRGAEEGLTEFLHRQLAILGIDEETARIFGRERGRLRRRGRTIGDLDLLIASTCLRHGLVLLTNNRRHFELVTSLEIISV